MKVRDAENCYMYDATGCELDKMLPHGKPYTLQSDSELLGAEARTGYLVYLEEGRGMVVYNDLRGCEILLRYVHSGALVGEMGLFGCGDQSNISVRTLTTCKVRRISYRDFYDSMAKNPLLYPLIIQQLSERLKSTTRRLTDIATLEVNDRIANALLDLCHEPGVKSHPRGFQLRVTRQELALMAGCSREAAGRAIKTLKHQGLMEARGKRMVIYAYRGTPLLAI